MCLRLFFELILIINKDRLTTLLITHLSYIKIFFFYIKYKFNSSGLKYIIGNFYIQKYYYRPLLNLSRRVLNRVEIIIIETYRPVVFEHSTFRSCVTNNFGEYNGFRY